MKKILLSILLSLMSLYFFLPARLAAENYFTEGFFKYVVQEDESIAIIGYFGNEEIVEIPNFIAGMPVSKISSNSFINENIQQVILPDTIMEIEENSFSSNIIASDKKLDNNEIYKKDVEIIRDIKEETPSEIYAPNYDENGRIDNEIESNIIVYNSGSNENNNNNETNVKENDIINVNNRKIDTNIYVIAIVVFLLLITVIIYRKDKNRKIHYHS